MPGIWDYLRNCARKHGLDEHIRYGTAVERARLTRRARRADYEVTGP